MTPQQLTTLKAAIAAETNPEFVLLRNSGATGAMADWYNGNSTFYAWRPTTSADDIVNAISWSSLTPTDPASGTAAALVRAVICQGKQLNLQILLQGRQSPVPTGKNDIRKALSDALQNVPAGTAGALLDAGCLGNNKVKAAITRPATRGEKLFAGGTGTEAQPGSLAFEGGVSNEDIVLALGA